MPLSQVIAVALFVAVVLTLILWEWLDRRQE